MRPYFTSRARCLLEAEPFSLPPRRVIRVQVRYGSQFRMGEEEVLNLFDRWGLDHLRENLTFPVYDYGFNFVVPKEREDNAFFVARLMRVFLLNRGIPEDHIDVHIVVTEADYDIHTDRYRTLQRFRVRDYLHRGNL